MLSTTTVKTMPRNLGSTRLGYLLCCAIIIVDQLTKFFVLQYGYVLKKGISITPFFDLVLVWNRGISFGVFNDGNYGPIRTWGLIIITLIAIFALSIWLYRSKDTFSSLSLSMILGGAIGNLIDRLRFEAVIDFLSFHIDKFYWPAFNVADTFITIGVAGLVIESLLLSKKRSTKYPN
ncbi:MAG: signal peptidase II [Alphaproteobacteria bacterium]|jgi:signal peptidase II|nr:signal peptidase II [Alphaproteobacteria bacterium]MBT5389374.1 signal peptidase II [Alphaproteobacteria bacterium]MBT5654319.1 signal peptidase II [Alphaproteobacteria bacterium]